MHSEKLKKLRDSLGKTQVEMGRLLDVSSNYVHLLECGKKPLTKRMARKIEALEKTFSEPEQRLGVEMVLNDAVSNYGTGVNLLSDAIYKIMDRWQKSDPEAVRAFVQFQEDILAQPALSEYDHLTLRELAARLREHQQIIQETRPNQNGEKR